MPETPPTSDESKPSNSADRLFRKALLSTSQNHLDKVEKDVARGATDQAREHLLRAIEQMSNVDYNSPSDHLSPEENETWLNMKRDKFPTKGLATKYEVILDPVSEEVFAYLNKKAHGWK